MSFFKDLFVDFVSLRQVSPVTLVFIRSGMNSVFCFKPMEDGYSIRFIVINLNMFDSLPHRGYVNIESGIFFPVWKTSYAGSRYVDGGLTSISDQQQIAVILGRDFAMSCNPLSFDGTVFVFWSRADDIALRAPAGAVFTCYAMGFGDVMVDGEVNGTTEYNMLGPTVDLYFGLMKLAGNLYDGRTLEQCLSKLMTCHKLCFIFQEDSNCRPYDIIGDEGHVLEVGNVYDDWFHWRKLMESSLGTKAGHLVLVDTKFVVVQGFKGSAKLIVVAVDGETLIGHVMDYTYGFQKGFVYDSVAEAQRVIGVLDYDFYSMEMDGYHLHIVSSHECGLPRWQNHDRCDAILARFRFCGENEAKFKTLRINHHLCCDFLEHNEWMLGLGKYCNAILVGLSVLFTELGLVISNRVGVTGVVTGYFCNYVRGQSLSSNSWLLFLANFIVQRLKWTVVLSFKVWIILMVLSSQKRSSINEDGSAVSLSYDAKSGLNCTGIARALEYYIIGYSRTGCCGQHIRNDVVVARLTEALIFLMYNAYWRQGGYQIVCEDGTPEGGLQDFRTTSVIGHLVLVANWWVLCHAVVIEAIGLGPIEWSSEPGSTVRFDMDVQVKNAMLLVCPGVLSPLCAGRPLPWIVTLGIFYDPDSS